MKPEIARSGSCRSWEAMYANCWSSSFDRASSRLRCSSADAVALCSAISFSRLRLASTRSAVRSLTRSSSSLYAVRSAASARFRSVTSRAAAKMPAISPDSSR